MHELEVVGRGRRTGGASSPPRAIVAGDSDSAVAATAEELRSLGFDAKVCEGVLDVLAHLNGPRSVDLVIFELARDGWLHLVLVEVLVREQCDVPMLILSDRNRWVEKLRAQDLSDAAPTAILVRPIGPGKLEQAIDGLLPADHQWQYLRRRSAPLAASSSG